MRWLRQQPCWYSLMWPEGPTFCKVSRKEGFQARFPNNLAPDPLLAARLRVPSCVCARSDANSVQKYSAENCRVVSAYYVPAFLPLRQDGDRPPVPAGRFDET
jgi:hypothetical protein